MENRYDKYKDSGIAWIGEIPEHWDTYQLKRCSKFINGYAFNSNHFNKDKGIPVIRIGDILNEQISFENIVYVQENNELEKFMAHKNDILIAMSGATVGKIGIYSTEDKVYINQRVGIIRTIQYNFIKRMFTTNGFVDYVNLSSAGSAQPNISSEEILNFYIPAPSIKEQQLIATYLDQKCSEIDELITMQEEMITKLQSYKQSVITEAVTKGLDKNVPLKDSGIEWIGKIPEHWNTYQLKRCSKFINGYAFNSNHFNKDKGIPVIRIGDILNEQISFENIVYVQENNELEKFIVHKNDILIAMSGATVGKIGVYNSDDKVYINQRVGIIRTTQYNYIKRMFSTNGFIDYINLSSAGSAQPNISSDGILNFHIPVPPLNEQQTIANYLDQKCSEIDELISIKQQKIEKLKDYKKSLIFECVTGKRKV
ncbi:restriction endonuclease subunit S [Phocaeicola plebeius]|uniref:restriction endonuclease subunit S n=1 Tax=Phocaeicola plebeius TaxID=310297 RepID=UPI00195EEB76|nr:restriction endonuclease subunit S [Phocaeicola plebeius]MBM6843565.1 restriction endonuclease subunit S [Phocaeicola plebeius]